MNINRDFITHLRTLDLTHWSNTVKPSCFSNSKSPSSYSRLRPWMTKKITYPSQIETGHTLCTHTHTHTSHKTMKSALLCTQFILTVFQVSIVIFRLTHMTMHKELLFVVHHPSSCFAQCQVVLEWMKEMLLDF